jgi:hypothetical protein
MGGSHGEMEEGAGGVEKETSTAHDGGRVGAGALPAYVAHQCIVTVFS